MENHFYRLMVLQNSVKELLKKDDIETALTHIFDFIEANQGYFESRIHMSAAIQISATAHRLRNAFHQGHIAWELTNRVRRSLIDECLSVLEYLKRDFEESMYQKRSYPHIGGLPNLSMVQRALEKIEQILSPYIR